MHTHTYKRTNIQKFTYKNSNHRYIEVSNSMLKLFINAVSLKDKGLYKCVGDMQGKSETKSISLDVFRYITFNSAPTNQHPTLHSNATIVCIVSGDPEPKISWKFNSSRIRFKSKSNKKYEMLPEGLLVYNISKDDNGAYSCQADVETEGRFDEKIINVDVYEPPKITKAPGENRWVEGDDVTMTCSAQGYPTPKFNFLKNGQKLEMTDRIKLDSENGLLKFSPLKVDDKGDYVCVATNDAGSDRGDGVVVVLVKPEVYEFKNQTVVEGQPISMECKSRGDPEPNVTIAKVETEKKEDDDVGDDNGIARMDTFKNGVGILRMIIDKSVPSDAGVYKCEVANEVSKVQSSAHLTIVYKPKILNKKKPPASVNAWVGKTRNVSCEVDAVPPSDIKWYNHKSPIENANETYNLFKVNDGLSVLQITVSKEDEETWIYGELTCEASNEYGNDNVAIVLKKATVPGIPRSVRHLESLPTGFLLDIVDPDDNGGEVIQGYQVEYQEVKDDGQSIEINIEKVPSSSSSSSLSSSSEEHPTYMHNLAHVTRVEGSKWRVDGLEPSTEYVMKVRARTEVGLGGYKKVKAKTESTRQPYPIIIKRTNYSEAFGHLIEWEKPITGGFPILDYEFRYRMKSIDQGQVVYSDWLTKTKSDHASHPMSSYFLDDLDDNTTYEVQVRAKNEVGWSDFCPSLEFTTKKASEAEQAARIQQSSSPILPLIILLLIVIIIVILVIIDVSCYHLLGCGVTSCLMRRARRGQAQLGSTEKVKVMEEGEK
ncbi:hypothetical protein HELRODRAFT_71576 [Helobdella robusta]|uniref:Uncharacterized protein n=1 Tax=Helobdella robusta TaxID=6412 RepID=T1G0N8_HELRO|nr:hypothetical protein HELRODRAFT_71576 [Helobdella robusta]ESO11547.1 hypothetical protein HELRODRAFT_71576 [Helobdella robusta]